MLFLDFTENSQNGIVPRPKSLCIRLSLKIDIVEISMEKLVLLLVEMKFSLGEHCQLGPSWVNLGENIVEVLTQLHLELQVILLGDVLDRDAVAEKLHQVPLGCGQQKVVSMEDNSGIVLDKLPVLVKLPTVGDAIQLCLYMVHYLFYFDTVFNTPTLKKI